MVKELIWPLLTVETYEPIMSCLDAKFGEITAKKFEQQVDDGLQLIATSPQMFTSTVQGEILTCRSYKKGLTRFIVINPINNSLNWLFFGESRPPGKKPE